MSEMNEPSATQHDVPSPSHDTAGNILRNERERQGLSLDDAAQHLNLRPIVVADLEEDRFDQVPIAAYRRGYVRAYARLLGIDETRVVNAYDATHGRSDMDRKLGVVHTTRAPSRVGPWIFRLFTLLVIIGLISLTLLWWQSREGNEIFGGSSDDGPIAVDRLNDDGSGNSANAAETDSANGNSAGTDSSAMTPNTDTQLPPLPTQQDTPTAVNDATGVSASAETTTPSLDEREAAQASSAAIGDETSAAGDDTAVAGTSDNTLTLTFSEASWTEIYDANDDRIFSGLQSAGSQATAEGEPPFRLTIGNASGVTLEYRGKSVDLDQYTGGNNVARFTLGD